MRREKPNTWLNRSRPPYRGFSKSWPSVSQAEAQPDQDSTEPYPRFVRNRQQLISVAI